jgi:hypothetical protein
VDALTLSGHFSSACCLDLVFEDLAGDETGRMAELERRTGNSFAEASVDGADIFVEAALGAEFAGRVRTIAGADLRDLEEHFGETLRQRPAIYVFASRSSFALGLQQVFGVRGPDAGVLAAANGGIALPRQGAIAINAQNAGADLTIIRHELAHAFVHEIIGSEGDIPAWLHEGIATLSEERGPRDEVEAARGAAVALSTLSASTFALDDLDIAGEWIQRNVELGGRAYAVSAEAVRVLEDRVGEGGLLRILRSVGGGSSFGAAFVEEMGESVRDFGRSFPARAAIRSQPKIVHAPDARGVRWSLVGFAPNSRVTVTIDGTDYKVRFDVDTDDTGSYQAVFGETAPSGEYTLRAADGARTASSVVRT